MTSKTVVPSPDNTLFAGFIAASPPLRDQAAHHGKSTVGAQAHHANATRLENMISNIDIWYDIIIIYQVTVRAKHRRTLDAVFAHPVGGNIRWAEIEALVKALGGMVEKGSGSRVHFLLEGRPATFHRPHPRPPADKGAVAAFRKYLIGTKISPWDGPR